MPSTQPGNGSWTEQCPGALGEGRIIPGKHGHIFYGGSHHDRRPPQVYVYQREDYAWKKLAFPALKGVIEIRQNDEDTQKLWVQSACHELDREGTCVKQVSPYVPSDWLTYTVYTWSEERGFEQYHSTIPQNAGFSAVLGRFAWVNDGSLRIASAGQRSESPSFIDLPEDINALPIASE